jgi:hypothetical protein
MQDIGKVIEKGMKRQERNKSWKKEETSGKSLKLSVKKCSIEYNGKWMKGNIEEYFKFN